MLWAIVVVLFVLWLLGYFGRNISPSFPKTGSWIHTLVVIASHTRHIELASCDMNLSRCVVQVR